MRINFFILAAFFLLCVRPVHAGTLISPYQTTCNANVAARYLTDICASPVVVGSTCNASYTGNWLPNTSNNCPTGNPFPAIGTALWAWSLTGANCPANSTMSGTSCSCNSGYTSTDGSTCVAATPATNVGTAAYDRAISQGYNSTAATCAAGAAMAAFPNSAIVPESVVASGDIAARIVKSGGTCASAQSYAAAAVNPNTVGLNNVNFLASADNCNLMAAARGTGYTGTFVVATKSCMVVPATGANVAASTGNGVISVTLSATPVAPELSPALSATKATMVDMARNNVAVNSANDITVLQLWDALQQFKAQSPNPIPDSYLVPAAQEGVKAEQTAGNSDAHAQAEAGKAAIRAMLAGATPAAAAAAGAAAAWAAKSGMTNDQIVAAAAAAAAGTMVAGQAAPVVAAVNNVAGTTNPTDYAKSGEAATAATTIATAIATNTVVNSTTVNSQLGDVPLADSIPTTTPAFSYNAVPFTTVAGCPAAVGFSVSLPQANYSQDFSINYQPACDLALWLRPIFLAIAAIAAAFIFVGALTI